MSLKGILLGNFEAVESTELSAKKDDIVNIIKVDQERGWTLCNLNDKTGWISTDFIKTIKESKNQQDKPLNNNVNKDVNKEETVSKSKYHHQMK